MFWIWITSLLCSTNTFAETVLAVCFRKKDVGNIYRGGPFYYISDGLNNKKLAFFYAFIVLISYIGGFLSLQVNTVSRSLYGLYNPTIAIGIIFALICGITILGGVQKIASTTSKLVPFMTLLYLVFCIYTIILHINQLPQIIFSIIDSAINVKSFGVGTITALLIGMQKGIFSSEVGLRNWLYCCSYR